MWGMPKRRFSVLVEGPVVNAYDVCCRAPRSGYGAVELSGRAQIVLPRGGVFVVERHKKALVVDPNTALIFGAADEYRVSHPSACGDDCTVLILPPDLLEEAVGGVGGRSCKLQPRDHLAICLVTRALHDGNPDLLEAEDATLRLLATLSRAFANRVHTNRRYLGPPQRARVEHVRTLLASSPTARWDLRAIGLAVHCSPYHLARQFRALTGETISQYLLRLRLNLAVEHLAGGERNLAALALELGFAHHSHFSARFRTVFGMTPAAARDTLTGHRLDQLRTIVAAAPAPL